MQTQAERPVITRLLKEVMQVPTYNNAAFSTEISENF